MKYGESEISVEEIFKKITSYDIFKYYIPSLRIGEAISSPLRTDDNPSFSVYESNEQFYYKDFSTGDYGSCFKFVMLKYSLTFKQALIVINNDFRLNLIDKGYVKPTLLDVGIQRKKPIKKSEYIIKVKRREWKQKDIIWWSYYGWNKELLNEYRVSPITHFWINEYLDTIPTNKIAYCYHFYNSFFKIYQPYASKEKRFRGNAKGIIQGYLQLPDCGDILFITSSMKDIGPLRRCGYWAIAPQSENTYIKNDVINQLKSNWNVIILFHNNDDAGVNANKTQSELYDLPYIYVPKDNLKTTDPSDYVKNYGLLKFNKWLGKKVNIEKMVL